MSIERAGAQAPSSARPRRRFLVGMVKWSVPGLALLGVLAYGASGAGAASTTVTEKNNSTFGSILADSSGKTLYTLTSNGSPVLCSGICAQIWPPLTVTPGTKATGPSGVCCLGTTANANGEAVTYKGDPLYRYANDRSSADATGDGVMSFGGTWHVVRIASSSSTSTTTTATTTTTTLPPATTATTVATAPTTTAVTASPSPSSAAASSASLPLGSPGTGGTPPRTSDNFGVPVAVGLGALGLGGGAFWRLRRNRG